MYLYFCCEAFERISKSHFGLEIIEFCTIFSLCLTDFLTIIGQTQEFDQSAKKCFQM